MKTTWRFGCDSWRIESEPIDGVSHLKLYANDGCIFEGKYRELVETVSKANLYNFITKNKQG